MYLHNVDLVCYSLIVSIVRTDFKQIIVNALLFFASTDDLICRNDSVTLML